VVFVGVTLIPGCGGESVEKDVKVSEKEAGKRVSELYQDEEFVEALAAVNEAIEEYGQTRSLVHSKYRILLALERNEEALETFEIVIQQVGDSPDVVIDKVRLLAKLGRHEDALEVARSTDEKSSEKSLYMSSYISEIYVHLGDKERALDWLEVSLERGDDSFEYYQDDDFQLLHSDPRFEKIIDRMMKEAGIGLAAKDFTVPLVDGGEYTLSGDLGKVVLIDFWATWCSPCVAEFPRLKGLYQDLQDKGFEIIGISLDSDRQLLENLLGKKDVPWNIGFSGQAMDDAVAKLYGVDSAPRYWIVDRKGVVRHSFDKGGEKLELAVRQLVEGRR
jgi:thiol-disulfide isomerase/thioredoxin